MRNAQTAIGRSTGRALRWVVQWWWRKVSSSWVEAWREPDPGVRLFYLAIGAVGFWFAGQHAFGVSFWTGLSFVVASFLAFSKATVFLVRRVPLGFAAPFLIFCGVILSEALRPVIFAAKDEALGGNLMAAAIVIGVVVILTALANRLKQGWLPEGWDGEHEEIPTRLS